MEINDEPLAYFITWSVYGTFLQGDGGERNLRIHSRHSQTWNNGIGIA